MKDWIVGVATLLGCMGVALAVTAGLGAPGGAAGTGSLPMMAAALVFAINLGAWVPASLTRSERFYDLTGTASYVAVVALGLGFAAAAGRLGPRQVGVGLLVLTWSLRLGAFLVGRIRRDGRDGRFDTLKQHPGRFLVPWSLQALWVTLTLAAALVVWSTPTADPGLSGFDAVGAAVWAAGFGIEVQADRQKSAFKRDPAHHGRFVDSGWWAWSRHPNYFGEIVLWVGIFIVSLPLLSGWSWLALSSPVFVVLLLTRVSGVPLLEARADQRWGGEPAYEAYKARTPVLVPRPPRR